MARSATNEPSILLRKLTVMKNGVFSILHNWEQFSVSSILHTIRLYYGAGQCSIKSCERYINCTDSTASATTSNQDPSENEAQDHTSSYTSPYRPRILNLVATTEL